MKYLGSLLFCAPLLAGASAHGAVADQFHCELRFVSHSGETVGSDATLTAVREPFSPPEGWSQWVDSVDGTRGVISMSLEDPEPELFQAEFEFWYVQVVKRDEQGYPERASQVSCMENEGRVGDGDEGTHWGSMCRLPVQGQPPFDPTAVWPPVELGSGGLPGFRSEDLHAFEHSFSNHAKWESVEGDCRYEGTVQ